MSANDPFNLDVRVATPQQTGAEPASWTVVVRTTAKVITKVTCKSCTCATCVSQTPISC
ncbi:hypothetical protein ACIBCO_06505 [Streptomyces violascens]|uniref:hypothetical protein n=1 Tax=Streptomyces violascens TaxID=67381 RepID=UPI00378FB54E